MVFLALSGRVGSDGLVFTDVYVERCSVAKTSFLIKEEEEQITHVQETALESHGNDSDVNGTHAATISAESPQKRTSTRDRIGIALALLALYFIWGSTYLMMHEAIGSFPPFIMAGIRFVVAGSILYVVLRMRGHAAPTRKQWGGAALIGTLMLVGSNGAVSFAEQWVASGLAAVALAAVPLWTALCIGVMGRWPSRAEWLGLSLGFVGVILLNLENGVWANPQGAIALLIAPICWALGSALSPRFSMASGFMSSATQMLCGGAVLFLLAAFSGQRMHGLPTTNALWAILYLIVFGSLVAFSAYVYLLRRVRPALATSYAYVNPVVAVSLGTLVAGERITPIGLVAMLVILTGVALVSLRRRHS